MPIYNELGRYAVKSVASRKIMAFRSHSLVVWVSVALESMNIVILGTVPLTEFLRETDRWA